MKNSKCYTTLNKPSIVHVLQQEGVELKRYGSRYKSLCPLHSEKSESFTVYPDSQSFFCFGSCNEGGDVIDLIKKLKGFSFKEALAYLGIDSDNGYKPAKRDSKILVKRRLVKDFRRWGNNYYDELSTVYRGFNKLKSTFKTIEEAGKFAKLYHKMSIIKHRMDVLDIGNDIEKFELFMEVKSARI